jgi:hypothetical protein
MKALRHAAVLALVSITAGCTMKPYDLQSASEGSALKPAVIKTAQFNIQTLQPEKVEGHFLRVYIEGDGRAWITSRTPSDDPTPMKSMMAEFALKDEAGAAYMARPCQFTPSASCSETYWTDGRFSPEIVKAHSEALDALKAKYGIRGFELVGYSGGAAVALLLAAQRTDVVGVQTIAGNVDHTAWTAVKGIAPLEKSLNPSSFAKQLAIIPQRHFIGSDDKVVPGEVLYRYTLMVQPACSETVEVKADHYAGFEQSWIRQKDRDYGC